MTPQQEAVTRASEGGPLLPLSEGQALAHGRRLRAAGINYTSIARVMLVSHGVDRSSEWWRRNLRARGAPPMHYANGAPRLNPITRRRLQASSGPERTMDRP